MTVRDFLLRAKSLRSGGASLARLSPICVIEAALLSSEGPLPVRELRRLFADRLTAGEVRELLEELGLFWRERGLVLVETAQGWRFQTAEAVEPFLKRLALERQRAYSRAALETLAVIVYRQPVTRGDIEAVRGVAVQPGILRQFEDRGWIQVVGRRESPGRPELFATTKRFLSDLGLKTLADLPVVRDPKEAAESAEALGLRVESASTPEEIQGVEVPEREA